MEFRILGPLELSDGERRIALAGARQRALLALFLTRPNEVVSADRLADELWGEKPPKSAANALQYHVSQLRKALAPSEAIETHGAGYLMRVQPQELDLLRFEQLVAEARTAPPETAVSRLAAALELWRGGALEDLANEPFAYPEIARLEELRLGALELRIEAQLALGRYHELVPELEHLTRKHPLRERFRAQLMRALYGADRQADALAVYRDTRRMLVNELGIEPSASLQELEQAILARDPSLKLLAAAPVAEVVQRAIIVLVRDEARLADVVAISKPIARAPARELILVRLLGPGDDVTVATNFLTAQRAELVDGGVAARVAAFTTSEAAADIAALVTETNAVLLLVDSAEAALDDELLALLARVPCDVGVLVGSGSRTDGPIVTPFGGVEHDWSAIEIAAWLARALETTLRLVGTRAEPQTGRRDASRLLARASLLVQQVVGIATEPTLVVSGEEGVLDAARDARLLVVGLSERWRSEGLGDVRAAVASRAGVPTLFVRRGIAPGGVTPNETLTRFTWTIASAGTGA